MAPETKGSASSNSSFKSFTHSPVSMGMTMKMVPDEKKPKGGEGGEGGGGTSKSLPKKVEEGGPPSSPKIADGDEFYTPTTLKTEDEDSDQFLTPKPSEDDAQGAEGGNDPAASSTGLLSEIFNSTENAPKSGGSGTGASKEPPRSQPPVPAPLAKSSAPLESIITDPPGGTTNLDVKELQKGGFQSVANSELVSSSSASGSSSLFRELANDSSAFLESLLENQAFQVVATIVFIQVPIFFFIDYFFK